MIQDLYIDSFYLKNCPSGPSKFEIEEALQPCLIRVDVDVWNQALHEYGSKVHKSVGLPFDQSTQAVIDFYDDMVRKHGCITYNAILSAVRCPRRYPVYTPHQEEFLLNTMASKRIKEKYMLSSLPRIFRHAFRPMEDGILVDFDLKCAHPSILASLSGDTAMTSYVQHDIHQQTGDIFAQKIENPLVRRNIGKICTSALIAGAGITWMNNKLSSLSQKKGLDPSQPEETFDLRLPMDTLAQALNMWWEPFEKALEYKHHHAEHIYNQRTRNKGYRIRWSGRTMVYFDAGTLNGMAPIPGWPKEQSARIAKATKSTFTGLLRSYESAIMDMIFVLAHRKFGYQLAVPMLDGGIWFCPTSKIDMLDDFEKQVSALIQSWGMDMGISLKRL